MLPPISPGRPVRAIQKGFVDSPGKRILCVDDDAATLRLRKLLLEAAGYSVLTAPSGAGALQLLAGGTRVDLVVLDYVMPGMNGDELAQKLRDQYPEVRLILASAAEQVPPALLAAVDGHLQKGQSPEVLLSKVAAIFNGETGAGEALSSVRKVVLCVEDEQLQLQLRRMQLESAGFLVLQSRSASTALELFQSNSVDAVVMDYWLSGKNGTAVAEEMKRLHPDIPIVMLSGYAPLPGEGVIVDAWLRKGDIGPEELVKQVERLIGIENGKEQTATS